MSRLISMSKEFDFDCAHWLPELPAGHKCARLHGHTYRVVLTVTGEIQPDGMLVDYALLARAWDPIHSLLDHRCLNGINADPTRGLAAQPTILENPTTENLVHWIKARFNEYVKAECAAIMRAVVQTVGVRVYESSTTYCEA